MRYRLLGHSGLRVSDLCLGTMTFGDDWGWGSSKDAAHAIYHAYRDAGGNFIDTANLYTNGTSEKFVGEFTKPHRDSMVIATKYTNALPGKDPNAAGNHRKNMMQAVEASLQRLQTSYIDLYWMHIWDQITPVEEVMRGFEDLVKQGKILYAGISDTAAWWIARGQTISELRGWTKFVGLQIEYSLLERTVERELLPMAHALNLGVTAWSPLAGGLLSGKYQAGKKTGGRLDDDSMKQFMAHPDRVNRVLTALLAVAQDLGKPPAQIALAWLRHRAQPIIPIIGARKIEQLRDNLASANLILPAEALTKLDTASAIELGFPHDFLNKDMVRNFTFAGLRDQIDA